MSGSILRCGRNGGNRHGYVRVWVCLAFLLLTAAGTGFFFFTRLEATPAPRPGVAAQVSYSRSSFRTIPGITAEEIQAVKKALAGRTSFVYGVLESPECFYRHDGTVDGYAVLFSKWLSGLFGIPFHVKICSWKELLSGLKDGTIDFTGDLTPGTVQGQHFIMTRPFMERPIKFAIRSSGPSLEEIAAQRPVRAAFLRDSASKSLALPVLEKKYGDKLHIVEADTRNEITEELRQNKIDLFITDEFLIDRFQRKAGISVQTFHPLTYKQISLATGNPRFAPIIAAIDRELSRDTLAYLHTLYSQGISKYYRALFVDSLNDAERRYYIEHIRSGIPIAVGANATNYPEAFYNKNRKQWEGIALDILAEITTVTGLAFTPVNAVGENWPTALNLLKDGDTGVPMVMNLAYNGGRSQDFLLADEPYLKDYYALISKSDESDLRYNQVRFYRVGLLRDSTYEAVFHHWFPSHRDTVQFSSQSEELRALEEGTIDLAMMSQYHFSYITNYLKKTKFKVNLVFEDTLYTGFGFNKQEKELRGIISKAQALVDTQHIVNRWENLIFDFQNEMAKTRIMLLASICVLMLFVLLLLVLRLMHRRRGEKKLKALVMEKTRELADQVEATKAASEAKSNFLANISHEIRTPLNTIIGLSELMLIGEDRTKQGREKYDQNLEKIYKAGYIMLAIVNDILDISKIEAGRFELIPVEYEMPSQINNILSMNILRKEDKGIRFNLVLDETLPEKLYGDELRIRQIFNNLLSNAFKYTQEGTVEWNLSWERDGESVWLSSSIQDSGIGIRPEDMQKLFTSYNQVDTKANRNIEGTGLGLAIAKKLVEMMDGELIVASEYGKGSTFSVRIRQGFVTGTPISAEVLEHLKTFQYTDQKRTLNAQIQRIRLVGASVLLVDDVEANMDVAKGMLKPYGLQIDCLTSGQRAIEAVQDEKIHYNAIFMDHMMPGMDGVEAMHRIRAIGTDYARNVPIIMLTANVIAGNEEMFLKEGFQGFLTKPIDMNRLDAVIRQWVRKKEPETGSAGEEEAIQAVSAPLFSGRRIDGIDLKRALAHFGGDEQALLQVLRSYAKHTPLLLRQAGEVSEAGLAEYMIIVHGVKGSSYGIGADLVGDRAKDLEYAAKAGDFAFVTAHNAAFIETAGQVVAGLETMLAAIDASKPEQDRPDPEVLKRLREACGRFDMDGMAAAMEELEAFRYVSGQDLVLWLREQVEQMNLSQIEEYLSGEGGMR